MKKSIVALAVLGAFAASASAQTNVTIYGVVDAGISWEKDGPGGADSVLRLDSGLLNGSRLGFKGTEDLGGGLTAMFQLENGFNVDAGTLGQGGRLFGRQAWVGLGGSFGSVKLGRQKTPVYENSDTFDPFEDSLAGDSARMFNYSGSRTDNTISYNYSGGPIRAQLQYGFGEVAGNTSGSRTIAAYAGYKNGPIDAVLTYTGNNDASGNTTGKTTLIGSNYDFGMAKLFLAYAWNKDVVVPTGTVSAGADFRDFLVGTTVPVGPAGLIRASYIKLWNKATSNADSNQIALGYTHNVSKRTALYTSVSRTANDAGAKVNAFANGATGKLFDVGLRHSF